MPKFKFTISFEDDYVDGISDAQWALFKRLFGSFQSDPDNIDEWSEACRMEGLTVELEGK